MCSTEQNNLYLKLQEPRYSFQDGSIPGSNRSKIQESTSSKNIDQNVIYLKKLEREKRNPRGTKSFTSLSKFQPHNQLIKKAEGDNFMKTLNEDDQNPHYFNEKVYEQRQQDIHNKIWVS